MQDIIHTQHAAVFHINGTSFRIPTSWITHERRQVVNTVQLSEQAHLLPVINAVSNMLSIQVDVPQKRVIQNNSVALLKGYLLKYGELWSSFKYQLIHTAFDSLDKRIPFTGLTVPESVPILVGYMGAHHYVLGGILSHFSSYYHPSSLTDRWTIQLESLSLTTLRQSLPMHLIRLGTQTLSNTSSKTQYRVKGCGYEHF